MNRIAHMGPPVNNKTHLLTRFVTTIDHWTLKTGHAIARLLVLMVLVQSLVVILRYGFEVGSIALQESVTYLHAICFMLGIAYTLKMDGHVRVDIFYRRFTPQKKALINLLGSLCFLLPLCLLIFTTSFQYVLQAWQVKEQSQDSGGLPIVYLLKTLIPLLATGLLLQALAEMGRSILTLLANNSEAKAEH